VSMLRERGEPFESDVQLSLRRMANLIALSWSTERYQQQRAMLARMEERQRVARDLHDDVAQMLFAAQMQLDAILENEECDRSLAQRVTHARALLIRSDTAIRNVALRLSSAPSTGISEGLAELVSDVEQEFVIVVHLDISIDAAEAAKKIRRQVGEMIKRVARESLVNAAKHAGPSKISVTLDVVKSCRLRLRVVDDGTGLEEGYNSSRHGLLSLRAAARNHGATLRISRGPISGTTVSLSVPL
jgi:signal transduction histidine kinase